MTINSTHPAISTEPVDAAAPMPTSDPGDATMSQPTVSAPMTGESANAAEDTDHPTTEERSADESAAESSLIAARHGHDYRARWAGVQGNFIDEPRAAVTDADALVGEVLDHLATTFRMQRETLEQQWADNESTTEDLRIAMRRYRTFFDRLLSL